MRTIKRNLKKLSNLDDLALEDNKLSGEIPKEIGKLINLQYLSLTNNQVTWRNTKRNWKTY